MFRGIEEILKGRDPRDAWLFTQRFCALCTTVHAIASVRAVENALDRRSRSTPSTSATLPWSRTRCTITSCTSTTCPRSTGWTWSRAQGRPGEVLDARREPLAGTAQRTAPTCRPVKARLKGFVARRPARHLHQRLLGPPRDEAAAGGKPARGARTTCRRSSTSKRPTKSSRSSAARRRTSRPSRWEGWPTPINLDNQTASTWRSCS